MKRNQLINVLQVLCLLVAVYGLIVLIFFDQVTINEQTLLIGITNAIKAAGLSISLFIAIIALNMFRN